MRKIELAHSPDADDIFMYYAIKFGWVDTKDYEFDNIGLDIETLNVEAMKGTYDVSAISFGMYPLIREDYALLRTAVSFGEGYGPKLVKQKGKRLKRNFKIALSGKYTTNAMLCRIYYPEARPIYMNFLEIEQAVVSGEVDAGVLIHESILDFDDSLEVEKEIWDIWSELAKEELCKRLEDDNLVRISSKMLEKYLDMYASDDSITLSDIQLRALDRLYEIGYEHNLWETPIKAKDWLIPTEYTEQRKQ